MSMLCITRIFAVALLLAGPVIAQSVAGGQGGPVNGARLKEHRRRALSDPAYVMGAARFLEKQKSWEKACQAYRHILLNLDPMHEQAYDRLMQLTLAHGLLDTPQRDQALQREFGPSFGLYESDHFLVVHDRPRAWAASRARMLELTRKRFLGVLSRADYRPLPLGERLVCLSFARYDDFMNYARRIDRQKGDWFRGYYSSRTNRIAFFDVQSDPRLKEKSQGVGRLERRMAQLNEQTARAEATGDTALAARLGNARRLVQRQLAEERARWKQVRGLTNITHAIHEATHQLAFNTGIQKRGVMYPMWFAEGLATSFETIAPAAPFGPMQDNPHRRAAFLKEADNGGLLDYSTFVGQATPPTESESMIGSAYAQSWALFVYLYRQKPQALRRYCFYKRSQKPGRLNESTLRNEFELHFGDPAAIGREVDRFVRQRTKRR